MTGRALLLALSLGACAPVPSDRAPRATAWPLADWVDAAHRGASLNGEPALSHVAPAGTALALLSDPYAAGVALQGAASDGLVVLPAYAEGQPAAYAVAEVWANWAPLWIQPLYVPVTAFDAADPQAHALPGARPVLSMGERASFYSPYWRVTWAVVPAGTSAAALTTRKAVLDRATELHEGPVEVRSLAPAGLAPAVAQGASGAVHPFTGKAVEPVAQVRVWAEGADAWVLDFGEDRIAWDEGDRVQETPLFAFATRAASGELRLLDLPRVGGAGPFRSGQAARAPGNRPAFGSLWRVYSALLPATAGAFVPSSLPALRAQVLAEGLAAPAPAVAIEARSDARDFLLRVALNPACFQDPGAFPAGCAFLDSQAALEGLLGTDDLQPTPTVMNAPLLVFDGRQVPFP